MAVRLLDRNRQIPYGFAFYQPETKWQPRRGIDSFDAIVRGLIAHRNANPYLRDKNKWAVDQATVENEIDFYNAQLCLAQGWTAYIQSGEGPLPKAQPPSQSLLKRVAVAGAKTRELIAGYNAIEEWRKSGKPPVSRETAAARAAVCAACPLNEQGDWTRWFTVPFAEKIRREIEDQTALALFTPYDEQLKVCTGCSCPMRLKVWTPLEFIAPTLNDKTREALAKGKSCWILHEAASSS